MLDVRRLVLLREVAVRGTLAAAAEALAYSPSAVSQQLSVLERETGVELLRKVGRRVQLTPQAEILVEAAGEVLALLERAEAALAASGESVTGRVRVAVFQSAALALMPRALRFAAERFPEVRVEMVQREPEGALHETWAREFDLVVAEQYPGHSTSWLPGLVRADLTSDAIRLAVRRDSAVLRLADARDEAWVMEPRGTASRHFAEQLCRVAGFEPDVRFETADLQAQIRLAASGNAVALMPDLVWAGGEPDCRLLELPGAPRRTIFTAQREAGLASPAVRVFRECLEEAARAYA
ncbi:LysR family transcriptional regulator [Rathayibacter caricis DSM 15933]|uniref:LysR family transcriptional regulator n=1 Tax=Rathayibacter caricis DSM 15933 TaxID=1328867 RepID=A0A2T4UT69_9MICO|nr:MULTISPECIES: LysR substrate-binding domain-containing protein [Rathayibacter]KQQ22177.1 LysR family transcriptional regulator [Rathayibacter sp. Leaf299]MCJ1695739.1 LysR substrate-binding domain-containing protein [Rathayibacter caricis]PTL72717.1 LysR family transcriptional regulator [Rathayibacter caricis DSM 15933]